MDVECFKSNVFVQLLVLLMNERKISIEIEKWGNIIWIFLHSTESKKNVDIVIRVTHCRQVDIQQSMFFRIKRKKSFFPTFESNLRNVWYRFKRSKLYNEAETEAKQNESEPMIA